MKVTVINKNKVIEQQLGVTVFPSIKEYHDYLKKSADRSDLFIMTDGGIGDNIEDGIITLSIISEYKLFKPSEVIILNKEQNKVLYDKYSFIKEDLLARGIKCTIVRKPEIILDDIRLAISSRTELTPNERLQRAVVQVKRGKGGVSGKIIPEYSTDNAMLVELYQPTVPIDEIKEQYKDNNTPLVEDIEEKEIEPIMGIDISEDIEMSSKLKYIQVTGNANSGCSTTAMILAKSGAEEGKTLLVDLSYSLGLSYLAEVNLRPDEYEDIDLTEIGKPISNKLEKIKEVAFLSERRLHIMRITFPLIRTVGFDVLEYIVGNLLTSIEDHYKYIILDLPFETSYHYTSITARTDLLIIATPPYLNNFVPTLMKLQETMKGTEVYDSSRMIFFLAGMANYNNIKPVSPKILALYLETINKNVPITGIHICRDSNYIQPHIFRGLIEQGEQLMEREEVK